jgi:hypothetical protein
MNQIGPAKVTAPRRLYQRLFSSAMLSSFQKITYFRSDDCPGNILTMIVLGGKTQF